MLVEDLKAIEKEYFRNHYEMVIPELLCAYYENAEYELTYYLSKEYVRQFGNAEFYLMMSLLELHYFDMAKEIYEKHKGDWFQICKQNHIYWKHVALFSIYFQDYEISEYYESQFNLYYDDSLIQFLELLPEVSKQQLQKTDLYTTLIQSYPVLEELFLQELRKSENSSSKWELITFENMKWKIWKKYNSKPTIQKKYGMELVYDKSDIQIYSYKPKEVSASMHIICDETNAIVLDCGCEINGTEIVKIPVKEILVDLGLSYVDAIFISHAHMDHYGSLNELRKQNVIMTLDTKQLIRLSSPEIALGSIHILENMETYEINGIRVRFLTNGHIRGSVMMDIDWKGYHRILYTGDYTTESQKTVGAFNSDVLFANQNVDVLLTETTYGYQKEMLKLCEYEKIFTTLCRKYYENGNKIVIPCFAIGRVQEVALLLTDMAKETGAKILIDGLASKVTEYYQISMKQNILNKNISISTGDLDYSEKIMNNDIILASSGMMREGSTSANYIKQLIEQEHICVMKVGFIHKHEHLLTSILNRRKNNLHFVDIPLSAHAGYQGLVETIEKIEANCVIYVHGKGIDKG